MPKKLKETNKNKNNPIGENPNRKGGFFSAIKNAFSWFTSTPNKNEGIEKKNFLDNVEQEKMVENENEINFNIPFSYKSQNITNSNGSSPNSSKQFSKLREKLFHSNNDSDMGLEENDISPFKRPIPIKPKTPTDVIKTTFMKKTPVNNKTNSRLTPKPSPRTLNNSRDLSSSFSKKLNTPINNQIKRKRLDEREDSNEEENHNYSITPKRTQLTPSTWKKVTKRKKGKTEKISEPIASDVVIKILETLTKINKNDLYNSITPKRRKKRINKKLKKVEQKKSPQPIPSIKQIKEKKESKEIFENNYDFSNSKESTTSLAFENKASSFEHFNKPSFGDFQTENKEIESNNLFNFEEKSTNKEEEEQDKGGADFFQGSTNNNNFDSFNSFSDNKIEDNPFGSSSKKEESSKTVEQDDNSFKSSTENKLEFNSFGSDNASSTENTISFAGENGGFNAFSQTGSTNNTFENKTKEEEVKESNGFSLPSTNGVDSTFPTNGGSFSFPTSTGELTAPSQNSSSQPEINFSFGTQVESKKEDKEKKNESNEYNLVTPSKSESSFPLETPKKEQSLTQTNSFASTNLFTANANSDNNSSKASVIAPSTNSFGVDPGLSTFSSTASFTLPVSSSSNETSQTGNTFTAVSNSFTATSDNNSSFNPSSTFQSFTPSSNKTDQVFSFSNPSNPTSFNTSSSTSNIQPSSNEGVFMFGQSSGNDNNSQTQATNSQFSSFSNGTNQFPFQSDNNSQSNFTNSFSNTPFPQLNNSNSFQSSNQTNAFTQTSSINSSSTPFNFVGNNPSFPSNNSFTPQQNNTSFSQQSNNSFSTQQPNNSIGFQSNSSSYGSDSFFQPNNTSFSQQSNNSFAPQQNNSNSGFSMGRKTVKGRRKHK